MTRLRIQARDLDRPRTTLASQVQVGTAESKLDIPNNSG